MICVSGGSEHNNESHHHFKRIDSVHKIQVQIQNTLLIPRGKLLKFLNIDTCSFTPLLLVLPHLLIHINGS